MNNDRTGVYKILCVPTGKIYVGSSVKIYSRWSSHRQYLRKNKSPCTILQRAWNKYGESAFEFSILEECAREVKEDREQHYIDTLKPQMNSALDVRRRMSDYALKRAVETTKKRAVERTHCPHGHEYTPENTYWGKRKKSDKRCRTCAQLRSAAKLANETPEQKAERNRKNMERYERNRKKLGRVVKWTPEYLEKLRAANKGKRPSDAALKASAKARHRSHCPRGHEYVDGSYYMLRGVRTCRACMRIHKLNYRARRTTLGLTSG